MGSVYRARDLHFKNAEKLVAVKEMINQAPDPLIRQTIVENFEREANILVTLSHPSIPDIFDYFTHESRSYLVLEYVQGRDMEAILTDAKGFLPEDQIIAWALELCDVLDYLHNHTPEPIIFRDIKPSNIMINQDNHLILVDFGIAKVFKAGQKGTMIGTEGYSPPEQYRGEASPPGDIYAFGATLHHLLTLIDPRMETPFTFSERPIRKINPNVSIELEAVVNTALQYNPQDRFPSARAMKEALLMVARKTGALTSASLRSGPLSVDQGIKPLWTFECEDEIRGTPIYDRSILYVGAYDHNIYAVDAGDGGFKWKFPTDGGIVGRPLIVEGMVYIGSEDGNLYAISSRSGKLAWKYSTKAPIRSSPQCTEGHILIGSDDGYLHAVNMNTANATWKFDAGDAVRSTPFFTREYIYVGCESGEFFCMDFRGQVRWRFRAKRAITSSPVVTDGLVFFGSVDSSFYALDAKSGWSIWRFRMGKGSVSNPCVFEHMVYFGSADNNIYCVDTANAREIWRFRTEHQVSGSPVVHKESLYCGSADGYLYCIESKTGRLKWKYLTDGPITGTPVISNDVIYFGSFDHKLYALLA